MQIEQKKKKTPYFRQKKPVYFEWQFLSWRPFYATGMAYAKSCH
jgi:hypothetical protein